MPTAASLRIEIERAFEDRFPAALTPLHRTFHEVAATGVPQIDSLLGGGLPVGAVSELTGPQSSGRTSLALAFLAQRSAAEQICAWVDAEDALDPESAAANGVCLQHLLWVRCRNSSAPARAVAPPKSEAMRSRPWTRLDQALRATDLLLHAGGFAAIVLDLGDTEREHGMRIPLATWFRFRQAANRTRCCLLVLGKTPYAQSSAALVLECSPLHAKIARETVLRSLTFEARKAHTPVLTGMRKPPTSTWSARAVWEAEMPA
jgi:recombination protein RecA